MGSEEVVVVGALTLMFHLLVLSLKESVSVVRVLRLGLQ